MKRATVGLLCVLTAIYAIAAAVTTVDVDLQAPAHELRIDTAEDTTKGWTFQILNEGASYTNFSDGASTGLLYYATAWTSAPIAIVTSTTFTANTVTLTPSAGQTATNGTFACQLILLNASERIEAGRGTLTIRASL